MQKLAKNYHYFYNANPYKSIESIKKFAHQECLYHDEEIAAFNKPPGFSLLGEENAQKLNIVRNEIQTKFKWTKAYQYYLTNENVSSIMFFTASKILRQDLDTLIKVKFTSQNKSFLKYYAITTFIPLKEKDSDVFHTKVQTLDRLDLLVEEANVSKKRLALGRINTHQVEHRVLDYNMNLNVALLELHTTLNYNEGIEFYCMKKLAPCLGDNKYSQFMRLINNRPFLIDYLKYKSGEQVLNSLVIEKLGINSYMKSLIPLHLQLFEIDLSKQFKNQKFKFKIQAPLFNYFVETLDRLDLKLDRNKDSQKVLEKS